MPSSPNAKMFSFSLS